MAEIILHLQEVDYRGLFRDAGFSSLFSYCTKKLGYSEGAAQRRITAARCLRDHPELYERLRRGELSLCQISEISRVLDQENKQKILTEAQGKTKLQVQSLVAEYTKPELPRQETIRVKRVEIPVGEDLFSKTSRQIEKRFSLSLEADAEFMKLYEEARALIGPCKMTEVFRRSMREFLKKKSPKMRTQRRVGIQSTRSRHIPVSIRDEVFLRDRGQCTFVSHDGSRCGEVHSLELDHVQPFALGGKHTVENLRLLCRSHNQLSAERVFGRDYVRSCAHRHRGGN